MDDQRSTKSTNLTKQYEDQTNRRREERDKSGSHETNGLSIAGMSLAIVGIVFSFRGIIPLVSLIISIIAAVQCIRNKQAGLGIALIGIIIASLRIVVTLLGFYILGARVNLGYRLLSRLWDFVRDMWNGIKF